MRSVRGASPESARAAIIRATMAAKRNQQRPGRRRPTRYVIVHNHIRHRRSTRNGVNGFRWWYQASALPWPVPAPPIVVRKPRVPARTPGGVWVAEASDDRLELCDCGWQRDGRPTPHYRIKADIIEARWRRTTGRLMR